MGTSSTLLEEDRNSDFFFYVIQKNGFPVSIYKNKERAQVMLAHYFSKEAITNFKKTLKKMPL